DYKDDDDASIDSINNSTSSAATFLLTGIPGLEAAHIWISIPFCFMYLIAILGNGTILFIIRTEPSLHEPMYYFLSMLAATDLGLSLSTLPTVLGIFWFNAREISFNACFAQMFFIHGFSFMESSVLLAMAFDRFVAICNPLRYASILTNTRVAKIGLAILTRSFLLILPLPFLLKRLPYCHSNVLSHSYCLHQDVMKLACADIRFNSIYGLFVVLSTMGLDSLLILFSYILILKTVLGIASREERLKALNTCVSHICAVLVFYVPMIGLSLVHRFGKHVPPVVHVLMANVYLLVPPVMNPIIYSVKTKQIRKRILRLFSLKKI
uniref:consOR51 n=1 Tax=synthetic construct TaxID=32630 RepID=UPI003753E865